MSNSYDDKPVPSGHRLKPEKWELFLALCQAYGQKGNQGLNRLVEQALKEWHLPGFEKLPKPKTPKKTK
jgi:hypothetical protein